MAIKLSNETAMKLFFISGTIYFVVSTVIMVLYNNLAL